MKYELGISGTIDPGKLNEEFYFQSLIEQAVHCGLMTEKDLQRLQLEGLTFLAKWIDKYSGGYSSSIPVERAQDLMTSVLFTVSLALKGYPTPDDAIADLKESTFDALYCKGRAQIEQIVSSTKIIYAKLQGQLIQAGNRCHYETLVDGIRGFFTVYAPDFRAHETHITADYPLLVPLPPLAGIEFIRAYVHAASYENMFCAFFPPDRLQDLLQGYVPDYEHQIINLYEPTFIASLGCILCGADVHSLNVSPTGSKYLEKLFANASENKCFSLLYDALQTLLQNFANSKGLQQYMKDSLPLINSGMQAAKKSGNLHHFFPLPFHADED